MRGQVVWTGSSSLDLRMSIEQGGQTRLTALITFVAKDADTGRAFRINPLVPQTPEASATTCWEGFNEQSEQPVAGHRSCLTHCRAALAPGMPQDEQLFAERQLINAARKAARSRATGDSKQQRTF